MWRKIDVVSTIDIDGTRQDDMKGNMNQTSICNSVTKKLVTSGLVWIDLDEEQPSTGLAFGWYLDEEQTSTL